MAYRRAPPDKCVRCLAATAGCCAFYLIAATSTQAALVGQLGILDLSANGGINPATGNPWAYGDNYHLLYITTTTTSALSNDIATYNAFVQADATTEGMGTDTEANPISWFALGSTTSTNAVDNVIITGPVMNAFNSAMIAFDAADMWDFQFTQNRTDLAGNLRNIWTGSTGGGVADADDELGTAGAQTRRHWTGWTDWVNANANQNKGDQLYMIGVSEELTVSGPDTSFPLSITPNVETPGSFDLEWDSQAGKLYNLRTSTDLTGAISTWTLVEGDIVATPPTNMLTVAPTDDKRFYAVEEIDAPPASE